MFIYLATPDLRIIQITHWCMINPSRLIGPPLEGPPLEKGHPAWLVPGREP